MPATIGLIYTRVSSDDQALKGMSLDTQVSACRQYVVKQGWTLGQEYQDVMSGRKDNRPAYQEMLADVRRLRGEGRLVVVVVMRRDRLGRRLVEQVRCREELKGLGVPVHSVSEGGEVSDLIANILASVAEDEVRRLGQRVKEVRAHISAQGWAPVGRLPWGYAWRDATDAERRLGAPLRVLAVNDVEAPYVRELFQRVADGESIRKATQWVQSLPLAARGGRVLDYTSVRVVLLSPTVVARLAPEDGWDALDGRVMRWPAIISDDLWRAAQHRLAKGRQLGRQARGGFMLSGIARCPRCGSRMAGRTRSKTTMWRYRCNGIQAGRCGAEIPSATVDEAVLADIREIIARAASVEFRPLLRDAWERLRTPAVKDDTAAQIAAAEAASSKARTRLIKLGTMFVDGEITREQHDTLRETYLADQDAAETELARLRVKARRTPTLPPFDQVMADLGTWGDILSGVDTLARRDVVGELVEQVVPESTGKRGRYRMRYTWTPAGDALRLMGRAVRQAVPA